MRAFVGSTRHVADYLTDEVLTALAAPDRGVSAAHVGARSVHTGVCAAVLGREDSAAVLAEFARSNMFLVALDSREQWYRAGSHRGRDRVRRRRWRRRDGRWDARRVRPRVRLGRAADAVSWLGALASLRVAARAPFAAGGWGGRRVAARADRSSRLSGCSRGRSGRGESGRNCGRPTSRRSLKSPVPTGSTAAMWARPSSMVAARSRPPARARTADRRRPRGPVAGAVFRRRAAARNAGRRAARRAGRPRQLRRRSRAACPGRRRTRATRKRGRVGSSGDQLRAHAIPSGFLGCIVGAPWACAGVPSLRDISTRPSARRSVASVCDARRSPPSVTRMPCSCSRRSASRGRGWSAPPASSSARNGRSRGFPIRDGYR